MIIPAGETVHSLTLAANTEGGTVRVRGSLIGVDSGEPGVTAFPLPPEVNLILEEGSAFLMDGRCYAPMTINGAVSLGATQSERTLAVDALTLGEGAEPTVTEGVVELYPWTIMNVNEGALLWLWTRPGFQLMMR